MTLHGRVIHPIGASELADGFADVSLRSLEAITEGDVVYVNSSSYIGRAQANASSTMHGVGVAVKGVNSGYIGPVRLAGRFQSSN